MERMGGGLSTIKSKRTRTDGGGSGGGGKCNSFGKSGHRFFFS